MARRTRSDSAAAEADAFAAVSAQVKLPKTVKLRAGDEPFLNHVLSSRARGDWVDSELHHAANLARCLHDIERISIELEKEGDTALSAKGTVIVNPKHQLLETLSRRAVLLTRLLQIDALARFGKREDAWKKESLARDAKSRLKEADQDDLLAHPSSLQ